MHDIMVKPLPAGCRLTAIFDVSTPVSRLPAPELTKSVFSPVIQVLHLVSRFGKLQGDKSANVYHCSKDLPYVVRPQCLNYNDNLMLIPTSTVLHRR
jgi:hypothetical protein